MLFLGPEVGWSSHRWKELIEIKWQFVEFVSSCITLVGTEFVPPMVTPIFPHITVVPMEGIVQEISHKPRDKWLRREYHIDDIVELKKNPHQHSRCSTIQMNVARKPTYPSPPGVDWAMTSNRSVFIEVLGNGQTHENRES